MSVESAKAFIERMKTDEDFNNRVSTAENPEARNALAKVEGFDFSAEDMNAVKSELTDDELQQIDAGADTWITWVTKCAVKWKDTVAGCMSSPNMHSSNLK